MSELEHIIIEVAKPRPRAGFHGQVEEAQFAVVDGYVQLFSMSGKNMGPKMRRTIKPPFNARETAALLLRSIRRSSGFGRKLVYPEAF